jgi:2-polyprenyl-6-methoxyphenol hydroxylase-like FAD-dependent oxidoreductase
MSAAAQPSSPAPLPPDAPQRHAIVIGGSMAGLLAARVLADHYDRVTVIERDRFPTEPVFRPGVPQGRHVHVLLLRGQAILEQLFPGLQDELAALGAPLLDWTADCRLMNFAGWMPRFASGLTTHTASRLLLEWVVRQRLEAYSQIRWLEAHEAVGLVAGADASRVAGVRLRRRDAAEPPDARAAEELRADLVVDASGRDSHAPEWLETLGYPRPRQTEVNAFVGYASRWYQRPADFQADWKLLLLAATPPTFRGGVLYSTEGERWLVTLSGANRDYPPTDEEGFLAFAQSLPSPLLSEAIRGATPLSPIYGYRRTENRLIHFEELTRWPDGFVVLGDAVSCFNPIYGQGMTTAALAALTLDRQLRAQRARHPDGALSGLGRRFQRALARANALPWLMATGEDFRVPAVIGARPGPLSRLFHSYFDGIIWACPHSAVTFVTFLQVAHLARSPLALFHPRIALAVTRAAIKRRKR